MLAEAEPDIILTILGFYCCGSQCSGYHPSYENYNAFSSKITLSQSCLSVTLKLSYFQHSASVACFQSPFKILTFHQAMHFVCFYTFQNMPSLLGQSEENSISPVAMQSHVATQTERDSYIYLILSGFHTTLLHFQHRDLTLQLLTIMGLALACLLESGHA